MISRQLDTIQPSLLTSCDGPLPPDGKSAAAENVPELSGDLHIPPAHSPIIAGYANVYRGVWTTPEGDKVAVAIKEFKKPTPINRASDVEEVKKRTETRVKREIHIWSQIAHQNVHPLLGYRLNPHPRLISRWCRHGNLKEYLDQNPGLSQLDKLRLIYQVACGLAHLHSRIPPISHADVKPENVLINDSLESVLTDFGLSRILMGLGVRTGFTTGPGVAGTLNYMAPELFSEEEPRASRETDVYAFGGLILAVMSGEVPFFRCHKANILYKAFAFNEPKPEDHIKLPPGDPLWKLMRGCWQKIPAERPQMRQVLQLLERMCEDQPDPLLGFPVADPAEQHDPTEQADEISDMELDTPGVSPRGRILAFTAPDSASADRSPSYPVAEDIQNGLYQNLCSETSESFQVGADDNPMIERYIEGVGKVAATLEEIILIVNEDEVVSPTLRPSLQRLAELLADSSIQGTGAVARIINIQSELQCVQSYLQTWCFEGIFSQASSSCNPTERQKIEGTIWKALYAIRPLAQLSISSLQSKNDRFSVI